MISSTNEETKFFIPEEKNGLFIPQMLNSRIKKKKWKEGIGVIAADKDADQILRGKHGCCLRHWHSVFKLPQVNQKLMKYSFQSLAAKHRSHSTQDCSRQ